MGPQTECPTCHGSGTAINSVKVGQWLRAEREQAKVTGSRIAVAMGISPTYLSDLEFARRLWNQDLIKRYLAALNKLK